MKHSRRADDYFPYHDSINETGSIEMRREKNVTFPAAKLVIGRERCCEAQTGAFLRAIMKI
jgi:hypothetical protein